MGFLLPPDEKEELPEIAEVDGFEQDGLNYNGYIVSKVMLPRDGHTFAAGVVKKRSRDQEGELIGRTNSNPLLDSSMYEVQFEDGSVERYHANIIN